MDTFSLKIMACDRVFFDGESRMLVFPVYDGEMAIMAHHEQMTTTIEVGEIRFQLPDNTWQNAIVSDGILKVEKNEVHLLVYSAERPEEIDAFRAQAALERAKEQLQQKQSIREYHVSSASLARAMARLRGVNKESIN
ncbi:MAG: ATP synthase F1 subunit epsilon [Lachnospiraceae bacterium]|nr:ATP synthase F1 subunit epsilon [Lachnospiraceae bacterium]